MRIDRALRGAIAAAAALGLFAAGCQSRRSGGGPVSRDAEWRSPTFPADWRLREGQSVATSPRGMVASSSAAATAVGVEMLRRGGNAVDAAVATAFALAVTYPEAGNLGGGGYAVVHLTGGSDAALDFRETAPAAATRDMYLDASGRLTSASLEGPLAAGVPGSVGGLLALLERHGTLSRADVLAPAIRLAHDGIAVDSALARSFAEQRDRLRRQAPGSALLSNGEPLPLGARFVQPELARTLERIAAEGADGFYRGPTADAIVAEMRRGGGIITHDDLAAYRPLWREPVRGDYRGFRLLSAPPSSSGGMVLVEALNVLETFERLPPFGSTAGIHLYAQVLQRVFADRNEFLGDPAFVQIPSRLTTKAYARRVRSTIDLARATPTAALARPGREGTETTHLSVVDERGNAVAMTTTTNGFFPAYVPGAGFFLNNTMDDFAAQPGQPNMFGLVQGEANAIAPGKRPLSAMTPTIVLARDGAPLLILGARGGPRIISGTLQVMVHVLDHGMSLPDAMRAPRVHHQGLPDTLVHEAGGFAAGVLDSLRAMGHRLEPGGVGMSAAVMRVPGGWQGVVDTRRGGAAAGP